MKNVVEKIQKNKVIIIKCIIGLLICIPLVNLMEMVVGKLIVNDKSNVYLKVLFYLMLTSTYITVLFRKYLYKYAHAYVFVLIILMGICQVITTPPVVGISWDDEIHYKKSAYISWGSNGEIAPADLELVNHYQTVIYERKEYTQEGRDAWTAYIDQFHKENPTLIQNGFKFTKECIAYLPSAFGLALGHMFGMTFTHTFMLGKFMNILCYALIISLAIKMLDRGKILAAVIALFPTNIFLAASYSYDWWITSFVMLAYALFLKEIQNNHEISQKKLLAILSIMIIALIPKAVYFPLLFPMMLWKNDRYENQKICRILVIGAMVVLLASFLIPMLIGGGGGASDIRGGSDVNAGAQIKFILTNPLSYIAVLMRFLFEYLSPDNSWHYATFYAYIGRGSFCSIALPLLASACILDNNAKRVDEKESIWVRAGMFLAVAGSLLLVVTAMYVSFTPVGHVTVAGCQPRYLLPIFFPGLYFLTKMNLDVSKKLKETAFIVSAYALSFVYFYNMFELCIIKY